MSSGSSSLVSHLDWGWGVQAPPTYRVVGIGDSGQLRNHPFPCALVQWDLRSMFTYPTLLPGSPTPTSRK